MCLCKRLNFTASSSAQPNQSRTPCFPLDLPLPPPHTTRSNEPPNMPPALLPCHALLSHLLLLLALLLQRARHLTLCASLFYHTACLVAQYLPTVGCYPPLRTKPHCIPIDLPGVFLPPAPCLLLSSLNRETQFRDGRFPMSKYQCILG